MHPPQAGSAKAEQGGPSGLDLRPIRYLIAIVDEGSLAAAARRLRVTQSALSRSVQALELSLGVKLLDRGRHGASPTTAGRVVVDRGRLLLTDATALAQEVELLRGAESGELTIGAGTYPAHFSVGTAVARLLEQKPGLKVRVTVGEWPQLTEGVLSGALDVAVCDLAAAEGHPRLTVEALPSHQGVLFCRTGHPLTKEKSVSLESIRRFPLALTALPPRFAPLFAGRRSHDSLAAAPEIHVDTFDLARTIVIGSDVVGGAIEHQLAEDLRQGKLSILPLDLPWLVTRYGIIHRAGHALAPSLSLFMAHLREVEAELSQKTSSGTGRKRSAPTLARPRAPGRGRSSR